MCSTEVSKNATTIINAAWTKVKKYVNLTTCG